MRPQTAFRIALRLQLAGCGRGIQEGSKRNMSLAIGIYGYTFTHAFDAAGLRFEPLYDRHAKHSSEDGTPGPSISRA